MTRTVQHPLFTADWLDVVFVHFRVAPRRLQPLVPLPLDVYDGDAHVSLVAFTQSRLRPIVGGRLGELLVSPLAHHEFLNVRTYVRHGDVRGIFFMTEWIPNRLAHFVGPRTYGLPYRLGRLDYDETRRRIEAAGRRLVIEMSPANDVDASGASTDFLLERYTAFTHRNDVLRRFDVDHAPWPHQRINVDLPETDLLQLSGDWFAHAEVVAAHHSPGVRDVVIGRPAIVRRPGAIRASPPQPLGA